MESSGFLLELWKSRRSNNKKKTTINPQNQKKQVGLPTRGERYLLSCTQAKSSQTSVSRVGKTYLIRLTSTAWKWVVCVSAVRECYVNFCEIAYFRHERSA